MSGFRRRVTSARASMAPRADAHRQPAAVVDAALRGQLGAQLDEHRRLQLVEPTVEAAHRPAEIVFGEPERGRDDRILGRRRVARAGFSGPSKGAHRRVALAAGKAELPTGDSTGS